MKTANSYPLFRWPSLKKMFGSRELYQAIFFFLSPQLFPIAVMIGTWYPGYASLINAAAILIGLIILTLAIRIIRKRQNEHSYARGIRIRPVLGVFICCIIALTIMTYLFALIGITLPSQTNQTSLDAMFDRFPLLMIFMIVILAPVTEELVFRELLPHTLGPSLISFIASSLLFVAIHSPSGIMGWSSYGIMAAGFLFARLNQRSIYAGIAVHVVWNLFSVLA
ncbi:CPBP family intramembrane glutamic endopeptidase [Paenibacillus sp. Dod16]|uniref:CPBP family intramembrane glutamic endopeptidase n=1 Tax=Paenibacillus sp. Dod16 TaxID=3416392 RepID=UPI003CE69976